MKPKRYCNNCRNKCKYTAEIFKGMKSDKIIFTNDNMTIGCSEMRKVKIIKKKKEVEK